MWATTDYRDLTPERKKAFRFMWARCLLNSERIDEAIRLFHELSREGDRRAYEGLLDAVGEKLRRAWPGKDRDRLLGWVAGLFRWFLADVLRRPTREWWCDRFVRKLISLFEREDAAELRSLLEMLDGAGYRLTPESRSRARRHPSFVDTASRRE